MKYQKILCNTKLRITSFKGSPVSQHTQFIVKNFFNFFSSHKRNICIRQEAQKIQKSTKKKKLTDNPTIHFIISFRVLVNTHTHTTHAHTHTQYVLENQCYSVQTAMQAVNFSKSRSETFFPVKKNFSTT